MVDIGRELPGPIFVPTNALARWFPEVGDDVAEWRARLKMFLLETTNQCFCGTKFGSLVPHMHEGVCSRRDVMGWPKPWRVLIYTPYNCILLCPDCNLGVNGKNAPSREDVFRWMLRLHEEDFLKWVGSLPFRASPVKGLHWAFRQEYDAGRR